MRDLRVRETERIPQDDGRPLLGRETGERLGHVVAQIGERGEAGRIGFLVRCLLLEDERLRRPDPLEGDAVAARVHHQPVQPRRELRLPPELAQLGAELDERFLRGIPSLLQVSEELRGKPVDPGRVALDERVQRARVAARRSPHELSVARAQVVTSGIPTPLVQTGLGFDRLHDALVYALVPTPDSLAPEVVEPLLQGRFGHPYRYEESCESTQQLVDRSLDEGAIAACDVQTKGRGRQGREWETPPGTAILCSILLRPPAERAKEELSLVAGLATAAMVERALDLAVQVKWPNDVMVNRRKVAGVLAEAAEGTVVVGIGINVNQTREELPTETRVAPGSLYTSDGVRRVRAALLADLVGALEADYDRWVEGGLEALYDTLGARDFLRGRRIYVDGQPGVGIGIDRRGRLEVEIDGERRTIESGEVLFER